MCKLCDENDGLEENCQGCGRLICFDTESTDDVCAPAYVTSSGDLYCLPCGSRIDQHEEGECDDYSVDDVPHELRMEVPDDVLPPT